MTLWPFVKCGCIILCLGFHRTVTYRSTSLLYSDTFIHRTINSPWFGDLSKTFLCTWNFKDSLISPCYGLSITCADLITRSDYLWCKNMCHNKIPPVILYLPPTFLRAEFNKAVIALVILLDENECFSSLYLLITKYDCLVSSSSSDTALQCNEINKQIMHVSTSVSSIVHTTIKYCSFCS